MLELAAELLRHIDGRATFVAATVTSGNGSVPRRPGASLIVVVRRGSWTLGGSPIAGERTAVPAGQFLLHHMVRPTPFETVPHTHAKILVLPASVLAPQLRNRTVVGPADSAQVRLLTAHTGMVLATLQDLGPAGVGAAQRNLLELAKAVAAATFDSEESLLAPALPKPPRIWLRRGCAIASCSAEASRMSVTDFVSSTCHCAVTMRRVSSA